MPLRRSLRPPTPSGVIIAVLLAAAAVARLRGVGRFEVADRSMTPALEPGDYLITAAPGRRGPRRGDIAVFRSNGLYLIKRVIGLPGEQVKIEGGVIIIDGAPFDDPWWAGATRPDGEWRVPDGAWFVLGDNRPRSDLDSRSAGPVERRNLHSIALARYRPAGRARMFRGRAP